MGHEVVVSGIGGQGIQLLAKTLALAATVEGTPAMLSADYGGEMRGGPSKASVVIGPGVRRALPVLPAYGAVVLAHHRFADAVLERLRPDGFALVNAPLVDPGMLSPTVRVATVDAAAVARDADARQAVGMVLLGAYNAACSLVAPDSLAAAMEELLPPYRKQHAESNRRALAAGAEAVQLPQRVDA